MDIIFTFLHSLLSFIVVISIIVFVHEFGHYFVAKLCGVKITAFSLGFGKELFGFYDRSGTRWKFCALPFGGYVKMYGDASSISNADEEAINAMTAEQKAVTFHYKPLYKKAAIVSAGPISNFLLCIAILTYMIFTVGLTSTKPEIGEVMPNTPAEAAGLHAGDIIHSVDGVKMKRFNDIPVTIATNLGHPVDLEVKRGEETIHLTITPQMQEDDDGLGNKVMRPIIGIRSTEIKYEDVGFFAAVGEATYRTYEICATTLRAVGQIVTGERSVKDLKSPIGIAKLSGQAADKGIMTVIWLMAMLSANLGLINLFPIPVLDGGHLAYYAAEALRGKPLAEKVQEWGFRLGFTMILMLMAVTVFNDVKHIFSS